MRATPAPAHDEISPGSSDSSFTAAPTSVARKGAPVGTRAGEAQHLVPAIARSRAGGRASGKLADVRQIGVLASGSGTILGRCSRPRLPIVVVVADRPCGALDIAARRRLAAELVERDRFRPTSTASRTRTTSSTRSQRHDVDLVAMAGLRHDPLRSRSIDAFGGRAVNTHPALLPVVQGLARGARRARAGVKVTGPHRAPRHRGRRRTARSSPRRPCRSSTATPRRRCTSASRKSSAACIPR